MNEKLIAQLKKAIRLNDALYDGLERGEISTKKAGSLYEKQVGYETIVALKQALEEIEGVKNMLGEEF